MANYLVPSAKTTTVGTSANDTFLIETGLQTTIQGLEGNDTVSAQAGVTNFSLAQYGTNGGNDTIQLSFVTGISNSIYGGAGNDLVSADGFTLTSTLFQGGGGNDTFDLSGGTFALSTLGGNAGNDLISAAVGTTVTTSEILLGGGADTLNFSGKLTASTVQGGGGADLISGNIVAINGTTILGDEIGSEFYGNDTITVSGNTITAALIQGAGGADLISATDFLGTGATVNGNYGKDSITITGGLVSGQSLIAGGAGGDTITLLGISAGAASFASVNGGGGADLITLDVVNNNSAGGLATALIVQGGAGSDTLLLDLQMSAGAVGTGAMYVKYTAFTDSNIANTDLISAFSGDAGDSLAGGKFVIDQGVVSGVRAVLSNSTVTVTNGMISAGAWAGAQNDVTARAEYLDTQLSVGETVVFTDVAGSNYLFVQGSSANSGTTDDLVIEVGNTVSAVVAAGSAITVSI